MTNAGEVISIKENTIVFVQNGGVQNLQGQIENDGIFTIEGDVINDALIKGGNTEGIFNVLGNWVNNNEFMAENSHVILYGSDQLITGNSETYFNNLSLEGDGIKRLTLDAHVEGILNLNDRELATDEFIMYVNNPNPIAIQRSSGFVSSLDNGALARLTNSTNEYLYPVGSSVITHRYRPVLIQPTAAAANTYAVRLANVNATDDGYNTNNFNAPLNELNELFYHHIHHFDGITNADISFLFNPIEDGNWTSIGNWQTTNWEHLSNSISIADNEMKLVDHSNFDDIPYILANNTEVCKIALPNAFSPNNDGANDLLRIFSPEEFELDLMQIYNRWGQKVYESSDVTQTWDGTFKGEEQGLGTYVYLIEGSCGEESIFKKGNVTLLK